MIDNLVLIVLWFGTLALIPTLFWVAGRRQSQEAVIAFGMLGFVAGIVFVFCLTPVAIQAGMTTLFVVTYLSLTGIFLIGSLAHLALGKRGSGQRR